MVNKFNVRVYGIWLTDKMELLVTDEFGMGIRFTKFPGGGLEFGEGIVDCLKREFREEMNQEIEVLKHFYTTDFFQVSAFNPNHQVISIYYLVKLIPPYNFMLSEVPFDFEEKNGAQAFRLVSLKDVTTDIFLFPIDKKVLKMLKNTFPI
jgi:8-oxo-dGTP diphosphatase